MQLPENEDRAGEDSSGDSCGTLNQKPFAPMR